ncbi:MAG: hypothetical protein AMXMBFR64_35070 [Myxococcales bacterium]
MLGPLRSLVLALVLVGAARPADADPEPLRVLLVGSSSMKGALGNVLESTLRQWSNVEVTRVGVGSSGLARPDFYDWMAEIDRLKGQVQPHVVVINIGANDAQGAWSSKGWIRWGRPAWRQIYAERVDAILQTTRGRRVFWVGPPNMRDTLFSRRLRDISDIIEQRVAAHPHARFVDAYSLTSDDKGAYVDALVDFQGGTIPSRTLDGIHFTRKGAFLIAARILSPLAAEVRDARAEAPASGSEVW